MKKHLLLAAVVLLGDGCGRDELPPNAGQRFKMIELNGNALPALIAPPRIEVARADTLTFSSLTNSVVRVRVYWDGSKEWRTPSTYGVTYDSNGMNVNFGCDFPPACGAGSTNEVGAVNGDTLVFKSGTTIKRRYIRIPSAQPTPLL